MKVVPSLDQLGRVDSAAERRIASLLDQADIGEPATVFYSVHLPRHEYKRMSEIDFLVVIKGLLLVIEVKGGRLSRHNAIWRFTNRYGQIFEKREGPFEQARSAMFALERSLNGRLPGMTSRFGSVVVTPDQQLEQDLEWEPAEHIGPSSMTVARFEDALRKAARFWRNRPGRRPSGDDYHDIIRVLRPDFDRVPKLSLLAGAMEEDFVTLAEQQYDVLRGAESNERIFVTGGAGSGKTILAVETARRASNKGRSVLLTCGSPGVVDVMRRSLQETPVDCLPFSETADLGAYDVLVVDEAQDMMSVDDILRLDQLVKGGMASGTWRMFSDPNNQAHVAGIFDPSVYAEVRGQGSRYELPYNCRNTAPVVAQTQLLTGADLGTPRVGHGPAVEFRRCDSDQESSDFLDVELKRLRQEDIHPSDVVVLTLRDSIDQSSAVRTKAFSRRALAPASGAGTAGGETASLHTVQNFKGLEAAHVLVIDIDDVSVPEIASRLYVAMTRPRVSLWMAVRDRAWDQLTSGAKGITK
jgi:hypothetical protein